MITLSRMAEHDSEPVETVSNRLADATPTQCYSVTIFTQRWKEVRDFYVDILNARVGLRRPVPVTA